MSDGTGFPARTITKLPKYEYDEAIIEIGKIYNNSVAVTDIEKVEWQQGLSQLKSVFIQLNTLT